MAPFYPTSFQRMYFTKNIASWHRAAINYVNGLDCFRFYFFQLLRNGMKKVVEGPCFLCDVLFIPLQRIRASTTTFCFVRFWTALTFPSFILPSLSPLLHPLKVRVSLVMWSFHFLSVWPIQVHFLPQLNISTRS